MRNTAERIAGSIDRVIAAIGRAATWCSLYIVLAEFAVVVLRYALGIGSIRLQELVLYAHAALFMLAAAWTLQVGGHVRVDVFYAQASRAGGPSSTSSAPSSFCFRSPSRLRFCRCLTSSGPGRFLKARVRPAACRWSICSRRSFRCLRF